MLECIGRKKNIIKITFQTAYCKGAVRIGGLFSILFEIILKPEGHCMSIMTTPYILYIYSDNYFIVYASVDYLNIYSVLSKRHPKRL